MVLKAILPTPTRRPFADVTVNGLSNTVQWILALVVALVLIYFIYDRVVALGWRQSLRVRRRQLAAILAVLTVAVSYRFVVHQLRLRHRADGLCPRHARHQAGDGADRGDLAQDGGRSRAEGRVR